MFRVLLMGAVEWAALGMAGNIMCKPYRGLGGVKVGLSVWSGPPWSSHTEG